MKTFCYSILALFLTSCSPDKKSKQEVALDTGELIIIGEFSSEDLQSGTYAEWFNPFYEGYQTNDEQIEGFKKELDKHDLLVFMGTWCVDSRREVPFFLKILEKAGFPEDQLKLIGLDKRDEFYKKSPGGEEQGYDINYVPTFVFLKNGKEIGRIVESPINTLEADIETILYNKPYTPNYSTPD